MFQEVEFYFFDDGDSLAFKVWHCEAIRVWSKILDKQECYSVTVVQ